MLTPTSQGYSAWNMGSSKYHTWYVIMHYGVTLLLVSKIQNQIKLSTIEADNIALSQSMRNFIPVWDFLKEIRVTVFQDDNYRTNCTKHCKSFEDVTPGDEIIHQSTVYKYNHEVWADAQTLSMNNTCFSPILLF
jgi:hypothetical protein